MTRPLSSLWRWCAYGFYAILIFAVCVYITFPSAQFHSWLIAEADRRFGVRITAQALQSHTPFHMAIDGATLSIGGIRALPIAHLGLELHPWRLLLGQGVLSMEIKVFGGVMRGTLTAERDDGQWRYHVNGASENMNLQHLEERMLVSREEGQIFTGGTGAMQFELGWRGEDVRSVVGTISVNMGNVIVNVAGLPPVTLSALSGSMTRDEGGWWRTDDVRVVGENDGFTAAGQGRFLFDAPFSTSKIGRAACRESV